MVIGIARTHTFYIVYALLLISQKLLILRKDPCMEVQAKRSAITVQLSLEKLLLSKECMIKTLLLLLV